MEGAVGVVQFWGQVGGNVQLEAESGGECLPPSAREQEHASLETMFKLKTRVTYTHRNLQDSKIFVDLESKSFKTDSWWIPPVLITMLL